MSVELCVATTEFMGDSYTFIDCPGSVEFVHDMRAALPAVDAAVVVCEMDEKKIPQLQLILRELEDQKIPHFLFLNKIDKADATIHDALAAVAAGIAQQAVAAADSDLRRRASSRASSISRSSAPLSTRSTRRPKWCRSKATRSMREKTARFSMLETLADHDDELMEQLLEDIQPPRDKVFDDLAKELRDGLVCPVLMGSAARTNGVLRLLKALRHEAPDVASTAKRLASKPSDPIAYVLKTMHTAHGGKMSIVRVLNGQVADSTTFLTPEREAGRVAGVFKLLGQNTEKRGPAPPARRSRSASSTTPIPATRSPPASRRTRRLSPSRRCRQCWRSRFPPRSARTTSSSARRCTSCSRRIPRCRSCTIPKCTKWCLGAGRDASAGGDRAACRSLRRRRSAPPSRPSAIVRPSRRASSSAAATRSSRAVTASSATWCSTSSRCRATPASPSLTRSRAAWCRAIIFHRWRRVSSMGSSGGRSASRWSTSR